MGQRTTQRILECMQCNETPEDGEYLWEMGGGYMCRPCCDAEDNQVEGSEQDDYTIMVYPS
jgi:hypothetical protein